MKTALILTILSLGAIIATAQLNSFSLAGIVTDSASNEKLVNTSVKLKIMGDTLERSTITNANGGFLIENLKAAKYVLSISHVGFIQASKEIDLTQSENIFIPLLKANTTL